MSAEFAASGSAGDLSSDGGFRAHQDEASSVVWGMPGAVATAGICSAVLPLNDIGAGVMAYLAGKPL